MNYIDLKTPKSVNTLSVKKEIEELIKKGKKTNEISWRMQFVATDKIVKQVSDEFQKLKNKIAFSIRG